MMIAHGISCEFHHDLSTIAIFPSRKIWNFLYAPCKINMLNPKVMEVDASDDLPF